MGDDFRTPEKLIAPDVVGVLVRVVGEFSRAYKDCFGELPSDTLRRPPVSRWDALRIGVGTPSGRRPGSTCHPSLEPFLTEPFLKNESPDPRSHRKRGTAVAPLYICGIPIDGCNAVSENQRQDSSEDENLRPSFVAGGRP